jgi:hypothetical protein
MTWGRIWLVTHWESFDLKPSGGTVTSAAVI